MPVRNELDPQHPVLKGNHQINAANKESRIVEFKYGEGPTVLRVREHALDRFVQRADDTVHQWWNDPLEDREHYVPAMYEILKQACDDRVERRTNDWNVKYQRWRNWEFVIAMKTVPVVKTCYPIED